MLLVAFTKICPINLSSLIWACNKQLGGRTRGRGESVRCLLALSPPTPNSAPPSPRAFLSPLLCQAKRLRHSQAWEPDESGGMEGAATIGREERDTPVSWKPPGSTHCAGSGPSCGDAADALTWPSALAFPWLAPATGEGSADPAKMSHSLQPSARLILCG